MTEALILTVDLEWYYNGDSRGSPSDFPSRSLQERIRYDNGKVRDSVRFILDVLANVNKRITFFAVGELDEAVPSVLAEIRAAGHEIGLHSYRHDDLLTVDRLERELQRCSDFKRKYDVVSFRAPRIFAQDSFYPMLHEYQYVYDSSIYGTGSFLHHGIHVIPVAALPLRRQLLRKVPCNLGQTLKSGSIPFGSGITGPVGFRAYKQFIGQYSRRYKEAPCIFLHSWQLRQPHYPIKFLLRNPTMYPYSIDCQDLFTQLCSEFKVISIREYFGG